MHIIILLVAALIVIVLLGIGVACYFDLSFDIPRTCLIVGGLLGQFI